MGTGTSIRRTQATPSARRFFQRNVLFLGQRAERTARGARDLLVASVHGGASYVGGLVGVRGLRLLLNTTVAVLVLSLPFAATSASRASTALPVSPESTVVAASVDGARAQPIARGLIAAGRSPQTAVAEGTRPIQDYQVNKDDTLATIANFYDISVEALAFANGISDAKALSIGASLRVPPGEGALYTVAEGDTVESVATRFKVDQNVIMSYNRLWFEPEHFAAGQLIFVRGAELPALKTAAERVSRGVLAGPVVQPPAAIPGRLALPVGGRITQDFWWGHTGVDVAAPYGTGIGASEDGVVSASGWVPVGGNRVCVKHAGGMESCYYHTANVYVAVGTPVTRGQIIASIGLTGVTTGPHVHWECKLGGALVRCLNY